MQEEPAQRAQRPRFRSSFLLRAIARLRYVPALHASHIELKIRYCPALLPPPHTGLAQGFRHRAFVPDTSLETSLSNALQEQPSV